MSNGYVFIKDEDIPNCFYIAKEQFWEENGFVDDGLAVSEIPGLPEGFFECMEACVEYGGEHPDPAALLKEAGFREEVM